MDKQSFEELVRETQKCNEILHDLETLNKERRKRILNHMIENNMIKFSQDNVVVELTKRWNYEFSEELTKRIQQLDREKQRLDTDKKWEISNGCSRSLKTQQLRICTYNQ